MKAPKRVDPSPRRKKKQKPAPIRSRALLREFLEGGGRLVRVLPEDHALQRASTVKPPPLWIDPDTDRAVSIGLVRWAIEEGLLSAQGDGLFDATHSQTYAAPRQAPLPKA